MQQHAEKHRTTRSGSRFGAALEACLLGLVTLLVLGVSPARADEELDYGLDQNKLARVEITGNETFDEKDLKKVLRLREPDWKHPLSMPSYRPNLMGTQLNLLQGWYRQRGFHTVSVTLDSVGTEPDVGDILYISVDEGPRTYIDKVNINGAEPMEESELRAVMVGIEGQPAPADVRGFGEDIYRMRRLYWERGHLRVDIVPDMQIADTVDPTRRSAVVHYQINSGPAYTVREVEVVGHVDTRTNLITREVRLAPGDPFSWNEVEVTRQRLLQTSLFRDVNLTATEWDTVGHSAVLQVRVTENKPAFYEFGVGFGSRERIRALAAWGHNNLWGTGRRLSVRLRAYWNVEEIVGNRRSFEDGDLNYRGDILYTNPHILGRDYPLDVNLFAKRETRGESALIQNIAGFLIGTQRRDDLAWTNRLDFRFKVVDPEIHPLAPEDLQEDFEEADVTSTQTRSIIHTLFFEGRDDVFNPHHGKYFTSQFELAGGLLGGDNSFLKWSGAFHRYQRLWGGVLALRLRLGAARPYGNSRDLGADGLPYDDRFFAGGAYSVRGYRDNSLGPQITDQSDYDEIGWGSDVPLPDEPARGGNYQLITNAEWRFPIPVLSRWNFSSVLFFDGGNVWETTSDILIKGFRFRSYPGEPDDPASTKLWDYRYSLGTGLRLDTPFGPFRLDVGFPLKRARYQSLDKIVVDDKWRIHFSLGHVF